MTANGGHWAELAAVWVPRVLQTSIFLNVVALGLAARRGDAVRVLARPRLLSKTFFAMNVLMPLVAIVLWAVCRLPRPIGIALTALAASPVPPVLPRKTRGAGGSDALGVMVATSACSIVVLPLAALALREAKHASVTAPPGSIAKVVLLTVLAPLAAGLFVRRLAPSAAARAARPLSVSSFATLVVVFAVVLVSKWRAMEGLATGDTLFGLAAFAIIGLVAGHLAGGPREDDRTTFALATATRHPGVALAFASASIEDRSLVAPAILLYLIAAALITSGYAALRKGSRVLPVGRRTTRPAVGRAS